jgi:hypothetical protein
MTRSLSVMRSLPLVAAWVLAALCSKSASAGSVTFFQFTDAGSEAFSLQNNSDGSQTITDSGAVTFYFSNVLGLSSAYTNASDPIKGTITMTANSNGNVGTTTQGSNTEAYVTGFTGSITFSANGINYLSVVFGTPNGATLAGNQFGQSATFQDSVPPGSEVYYYSPLLDFPSQSQQNFAISLSSITNEVNNELGFDVQGTSVDSFFASATGTFAASPSSTSAPEPVTVASLGFGLFLLAAICRAQRNRGRVLRLAKHLPPNSDVPKRAVS